MFSIETDAYLVGSDDEVRVEVLTMDLTAALELKLRGMVEEDRPHEYKMLETAIKALDSASHDCHICGKEYGH